MATLVSIPGDIKSLYLPFKIPGNPYKFSFRTKSVGKSNNGLINICPSSFNNTNLLDDISFKQLKDYEGNLNIDKEDLLNFVPAIQIREFLPDTRLDQCINMFTDILGTVTDLFTKDKKALESLKNKEPKSNPEGKTNSFFLQLTKAMNWSLKYFTGTGEENLYKSLAGTLKAEGAQGSSWSNNQDLDNYILNFPYILYYRFQSCNTTGLYELPCITEDKRMYSSEGKGWDGANTFELVNSFLGNIPVLGTLMKTLLGNVRISYLPWWDSLSGQGTAEPEITVKFDLFNDTANAAIMNFIFVNTLVPSNRWIQYNMFLHSSNLYDVKLEGYNRLFACTGKFDVNYVGVLREPSTELINKFTSYKNTSFKLSMDLILKQHLIKIPDVYKVTLTFSSILPANFNNYIYSYVKNNNVLEEYNGKTKQKSVATKMFNEGLKDFESKLESHWPNGFPE